MSSLPKLTMLHGSRGNSQELLPLARALTQSCSPVLPNLLGHGGRPIPNRLSVSEMALDVLKQLDEHAIKTTYVFGYSFGGYLALYLAKHRPERILGVCTLSTKIVFDPPTVALWTHLSGVERIRSKQKELMDERHPGQDWDRLVAGLADLYRELGKKPALTDVELSSIAVPTLTLSASDDQLVPWEESLKLAYAMPRGHGFSFAGQAHPLKVIPVPFLASVVGKWLECICPRSTA